MIGQPVQSLECLKAEGISALDQDTKLKFDTLASGILQDQPVNVKQMNLLNQSAIHMCAGQFDQAKQCIDQVLEGMELKLQTTEHEAKLMLPSYIVNILVYFYIKTSKQIKQLTTNLENYKMARQLLKYRRLVVDTNHIETVGQAGISIAQKARNKSKTLIKSFT